MAEERQHAAEAKTQWVLDNLLKPLADASRELVKHHGMTCLASHHRCEIADRVQARLDGIACSL